MTRKVKVIYYLDDSAQKQYLLAGENASKKQVLFINAKHEILDLPICKIDTDGNAVIHIGSFLNTPLFPKKYSAEEFEKILIDCSELCDEDNRRERKLLISVAFLIGFFYFSIFLFSKLSQNIYGG